MIGKIQAASSRGDRKIIERDRRTQMRALYSKLNSLLPHQSSTELVSQSDQLEEAANYIKKIQIKLEKLNEKKLSLMGIENELSNTCNRGTIILESKSPKVEIHQMGSALEVSVITGLDCQFIFNEFISILHEEEADVVHASYSVVHDAVFHTIHSQIGDGGNRAGRISERLKRFAYGSGAF
ncbi:transcription factor bHLH162-like [Prosopis cineraria]|uniref:transcription factor bHLH162-like n=1 Tax=Prosopis cineraria TaxID=364024 RepID=UPI00240F7787|nr:transcription factor bHLH162-like [Prosopis cineraria]